MDEEPITQAFHRYFDLSQPQFPDEVEPAFRLRYEVYCREFGFEREEDCPNGLESDGYDSRSWHCLMHHRSSGASAGCVRIVPTSATSGAMLPMEEHCRDSFWDVPERPDRLDRESICEVSRLAVHGLFRRRQGEHQTPLGDVRSLEIPPNHVRTFPILALSLFMSATAMATIHEKEHAFAMMEPALARILRRSGLPATQIGELQDYHGQRAAFHIHRDTAKQGIENSALLRDLYLHAYHRLSTVGQSPFAESDCLRAA
ncbi:PEP-CTERM/exosortase system-associated acyltransferase [Thioalkalivibrio sp. ALJ7]|uniref:PEP-CTERM/exosortase system-associated acyltransferase n=1 Tax=Thioalkalivibrio sp. ALJ7 TaxID=1158756 RepID=UPI00036B2203|nr:PEP-CTERM/exosortase system-associated acyltransferase [Thioalkalivibrio sp. ALJ7]